MAAAEKNGGSYLVRLEIPGQAPWDDDSGADKDFKSIVAAASCAKKMLDALRPELLEANHDR
jgi:hypothetical protein